MDSPVKQRLKYFLKYKNLGQNRFASMCGLSSGFVNNIVVSIQPKTLLNITKQFPELNAAWLLTGEGEMLKQPGEEHPHPDKEVKKQTSTTMTMTKETFDLLKKQVEIINSQQYTINAQQATIDELIKKIKL